VSGQVSAWDIRIICTDKRTHPSRELALFTIRDDPRWRQALADDPEFTPAEAAWLYENDRITQVGERRRHGGGAVVSHDAESEPDPGARTRWRFTCPECGRDVPLRDETFRRLLDGVLAAGWRVVDLSDLPC
jgi:hypothetical protein